MAVSKLIPPPLDAGFNLANFLDEGIEWERWRHKEF
jgi:hypothetical protein